MKASARMTGKPLQQEEQPSTPALATANSGDAISLDTRRLTLLPGNSQQENAPAEVEPASNADTLDNTQYLRRDQSIFLQGDKQCWLIQVKEISLLESEGNYTRVYFGKEKTLILRSLNSLEERLDPKMFFRASRKHIINVSAIEKIIPAATRTLLVTLRDGFRVEMSRRQTQLFRALMTL